jgi:hypothetical protein
MPVLRCHGRGIAARRPKRPQGDLELRRGTPPVHVEVERLREIGGGCVPYGEGAELPAPLDQAQHRGVVEDDGRHVRTRLRGNEKTRHAKAQEPIGRSRGQVSGREIPDRPLRGRHMIEEATPFVVGNHEHGPPPGRTAGNRGVDQGQEGLAIADVGIDLLYLSA